MPATVKEPLVELRNLSFGYGESAVLDDVCLRIPRGKVTALIGPMGAGKTTTLRLIGGECRAWSGAVLFDAQSTGVTYTVYTIVASRPGSSNSRGQRSKRGGGESVNRTPECAGLQVFVPCR